MRRFGGWLLILVLAGAMQTMAAGLITKKQAEQDALNAVGGGAVISAVRDTTPNHTKIWSVDIRGAAHEYEVWVDAHTGAILKIITQPLAANAQMLSSAEAEAVAVRAVGEGEILQSELARNTERTQWVVDVKTAEAESEVRLDAYSGAVMKITTQIDAANNCTFTSKKQAKAIALAAVNANRVLSIRLERNDNPVVWSVDVRPAAGQDFEVKIDACSGKVVAIIPG